MKIIATLADMIDDEVSGAKEYICWAGKTKEKDHHSNVHNKRICKDGPLL